MAAAARRAGLPFGGHVSRDVSEASDNGLVIVDHLNSSGGLDTLGTDAGRDAVGYLLPGMALHAELAIYVAEGLTPLEALQSATLNPAKMLQGTDSLGTVAPGKLADLVLLGADPLADITNITAIRAVVANGRFFDRAALDSLVAEAQARGP